MSDHKEFIDHIQTLRAMGITPNSSGCTEEELLDYIEGKDEITTSGGNVTPVVGEVQQNPQLNDYLSYLDNKVNNLPSNIVQQENTILIEPAIINPRAISSASSTTSLGLSSITFHDYDDAKMESKNDTENTYHYSKNEVQNTFVETKEVEIKESEITSEISSISENSTPMKNSTSIKNSKKAINNSTSIQKKRRYIEYDDEAEEVDDEEAEAEDNELEQEQESEEESEEEEQIQPFKKRHRTLPKLQKFQTRLDVKDPEWFKDLFDFKMPPETEERLVDPEFYLPSSPSEKGLRLLIAQEKECDVQVLHFHKIVLRHIGNMAMTHKTKMYIKSNRIRYERKLYGSRQMKAQKKNLKKTRRQEDLQLKRAKEDMENDEYEDDIVNSTSEISNVRR